MSLHCLAILGSKNEPLYICSSDHVEYDNDGSAQVISPKIEDAFGFSDESSSAMSEYLSKPASMRHEVSFTTWTWKKLMRNDGE